MGRYAEKKEANKNIAAANAPAAQLAEKTKALQLPDNRPRSVAQKKQVEFMAGGKPVQTKANNTGLPEQLKSGVENLSGHSIDDVKVHYNSGKPAQLNALAYAQGTDIHVAPGQEKHLPHEAWHVAQQKQGRVKPTMQMKGNVNVNDDKGLEMEANVMGAKALQTKRSNDSHNFLNQLATGNTVQRIWTKTSLTKDYYRWDRPLAGLRWYASKTNADMYFMVESPNEENRHVIRYQGMIKPFEEWKISGLFNVTNADNAIDHSEPQGLPDLSRAEGFGPHIFRPVAHKRNKETGRMEISTAHYQKSNQNEFEEQTGTALSKHKRKQGEENLALRQPANLGRFVYHLSTLRNLMLDPNTGNPLTGILSLGLDPNKGGGKGGACETCENLKDVKMIEGSKKNSKNVVAVTTSAFNIKMYANQRVEHSLIEFEKGTMSLSDLLTAEPILLRFKLTQPHLNTMEIDPQHPNDDTVRLIRGIAIPPATIEALTSSGWIPLPKVGKELFNTLGHIIKVFDSVFHIAMALNISTPKDMHAKWVKIGEKEKKAVRALILNYPTFFYEAFKNLFHKQRKGTGKGLAGYSMK